MKSLWILLMIFCRNCCAENSDVLKRLANVERDHLALKESHDKLKSDYEDFKVMRQTLPDNIKHSYFAHRPNSAKRKQFLTSKCSRYIKKLRKTGETDKQL